MEHSSMYFDTHRTQICKDFYKPSSGFVRFFKSLWTVLMVGQSPITATSYYKKRPFHK